MSCFSVIAVVLIASLVVPAGAASWTTLLPADYISDVYYVGDFRYVVYDFTRPAYIRFQCGSTVGNYMGSVSVLPNVDHSLPMTFAIYPLGAHCVGGPPLTSSASGSIAIDVSDFKPNASMTVSSNLTLEYDISYWSDDVQVDERFSISTEWSFHGYKENGGYVGSIERQQTVFNGTMQDMPEDFVIELPISLDLNFSEFPETVKYVVSCCTLTYTTTEDASGIHVYYFKLSCDSFSFTTRTDMLLKNSITLDAIEDELEDLNEKADQILSGSQEQQDAADEGKNEVENSQQKMDEILAQLDDYEKLDTAPAMQAIRNFLNEDGWSDVRELIGPVIDWGPTVTIMLIVLSLVSLSVILFGR